MIICYILCIANRVINDYWDRFYKLWDTGYNFKLRGTILPK